MGIADLIMTVTFLVTPPLLLAVVRHRFRAATYSVFALWLLMIAGAQYHLAYTPDYDSIAPGLALVAGWFRSVAYTLIWVGIFALIGLARSSESLDKLPHSD